MSKTTNFDMNVLEGLVDVSELNENFGIIDEEMAKPPLTVNNTQPDASRNIQINEVPLADNLVSDESQVATGAFVLRSSGGDASIASGTANISSISGNAVKTGFVQESINLTVVPISTEGEPISAYYDRDTLVSYMGSSGTVTFTYSTSWNPSIAPYGITVNGTPDAGDVIILDYTKGNRGTITIPNPVKFISTGWNLYNHTAGYARVPKYSDNYGFIISGSYTTLEFAATQTGSRSTIVPVSGHFTIPSDGYLFVTGGNGTNTAIYMTWSDWTDGTPESFQAYTQEEVDLSGVMTNFPNGLMRVGNVADEINFNTQQAISRIARIAYDEDDLATIIASGLPYDTDQNYIYYAKSEATTYSIDIDGEYTASDHGTEFFTGITVPAYATIIYGQDLAGKLRRDVVTVSPMDLTPEQQEQVRKSIGALGEISGLNGLWRVETQTALGRTVFNANQGLAFSYTPPQYDGYSIAGVVGFHSSNDVANGTGESWIYTAKCFYDETSKQVKCLIHNANTNSQSIVKYVVKLLYFKT